MATTVELPEKIETLFSKLDEQKTLLTKCTDLYKTLTNHFTILENSIDVKSKTLDSNLQTLDSAFQETIDSLQHREDSLPDFTSLSSAVESRRIIALSEVSKPLPDDSVGRSETLKYICRRMDPRLLLTLLVGKRRGDTPALRVEMTEALSECVDAERFVIDAVRAFVDMKRDKTVGLTDKRWACSMVVASMFPPEDLKERKAGSRVLSKKTVQRAEEVLKEWRKVADNVIVEAGGEGTGIGPAEAAMFIEVVLGFGLRDSIEEEFYKELITKFCGRRDMAKLAVPVFGDKVADFIEELVKNGKEVEAVYFASEAGLTERFPPVQILKSSLRKARKNFAEKLKQGKTDESHSIELSFTRSLIKCVEDHKIEEQFPVESLRKRLVVLEKVKADKKKVSTASHSKRAHTSAPRVSGPPPPRPAKMQKLSSPYTTFARRDTVSPARLSPVSRYLGPYTYPSQTTYDTGLAASTYAPSYVGAQIPAPAPAPAAPAAADQITQQYYGIPGDNLASSASRLSSSYGSQVGYASYDYGAAATPAYHPPSYPQ